MVSKRYMLHDPGPPTPAKVFVDQQVIPTVIDALAGGEALLERLAGRIRAAPLLAVVVAGCIGAAAGTTRSRRKP